MFRQTSAKKTNAQTQARQPNKQMVEIAGRPALAAQIRKSSLRQWQQRQWQRRLNQRFLRATSWYELFAPLRTCDLAFFAKFMPLFVGYTCRQNCCVCKEGLIQFKKESYCSGKDCCYYYLREFTFFRNHEHCLSTGNSQSADLC